MNLAKRHKRVAKILKLANSFLDKLEYIWNSIADELIEIETAKKELEKEYKESKEGLDVRKMALEQTSDRLGRVLGK